MLSFVIIQFYFLERGGGARKESKNGTNQEDTRRKVCVQIRNLFLQFMAPFPANHEEEHILIVVVVDDDDADMFMT